MSLTTLMLALAPGIAARFRSERPDAARALEELRDERDVLRARLETAWRRIEELTVERDQTRLRLDQIARARIDERLNPVVLTPAQQAAFAQQQYAAQQAQANAQMAQYHQLQAMQNAMVYGQGALLGAQNLAMNEMWCNCVPSRAQVWAVDGTLGG